ncbi:MAG: DUF6785 family protein [Armatimonadia bacterium]
MTSPPVTADDRPQTVPAAKARCVPEAVSPRAVILGVVLIPVNAWWLAQIEYVRYSDNATTSALFFNCLAVLLFLIGLNHLIRLIAPRHAFSRGELLTVYAMLVIASALGGHDQLQILFTTITWIFRNATPENGWEKDLMPHLPGHLVMNDPRALESLYSGDSTLYSWPLLRPWLAPLGWWALFALTLVWTLYCLMAMFRKQWDRERLNYPIAGVPLQMTAPDGELYHSKLFWVAFAGAMLIQLWRLAHNLWPAVPNLNIGVFNYSFKAMPLSAAGAIPLSSYPFSYGMAYLLPVQLAFSVWFFFWLARLEMILTAMAGFTQFRRFPYVQQQGVGAYFGVALFVLWAARMHLRTIWLLASGQKRNEGEDAGEPLPYPTAFWGFFAGACGLVVFAVAAGMSLLTALLYFALFLTISLTLTRLRAELGLPTIELYQVGADDILQNLAGTRAFTSRDLAAMSLFFWLHRTHRQLPMPIHGDLMRLGDQSPLNLRGLSRVVLLASAVAIVAAFWGMLHVTYQTGYESAKFVGPAKWAFGNDPWRKLQQAYSSPRSIDYGASGAYLFGLGFTLFLAAMRSQFLWWPFHPVGYLVSGSFGLFRLWLPIFITWTIKSLLLRYGGLDAYRKAWPFFIGLILGEFSGAFLRTVLDLVFTLYLPPSSGVGGL